MKSFARPTRIAVALLVLGPVPAFAQSGYDLLQQGLLQERTYGDLERAAETYDRIVSEFSEDRRLTATVLLQLGSIYEKLGIGDRTQAAVEAIRLGLVNNR